MGPGGDWLPTECTVLKDPRRELVLRPAGPCTQRTLVDAKLSCKTNSVFRVIADKQRGVIVRNPTEILIEENGRIRHRVIDRRERCQQHLNVGVPLVRLPSF